MSPQAPPPPPDTSAPPPGKPFVDVADLCARYGVKSRTVYSWLQRSKPGGIYANRPVPEPADYTGGDPDTGRGGNPYWLLRQLPAWDKWRANMVGRGVGGGRPRKDRDSNQPNH